MMNMQRQMQEQMQQLKSEMQQGQQKFALLEQNVRTHIKSQNTQRITNDARDRLLNERRFGTETPTQIMVTHHGRTLQQLEMWQWNCRGYRQKQGLLQQFIYARGTPPDVIMLQETNCTPTLRGYTCQENGRTATLISKQVVAIAHNEIKDTRIEHVITEIIPKKKARSKSTYIINLYSPPRQKDGDFIRLFTEAKKFAGNNTLVIAGDFNAKSPRWGYNKDDKKGRGICAAAEQAECELLTDEHHPTRQGNSVSSDTCPDLTFVRGARQAEWENLLENLGSDHHIIRISTTANNIKRKIGKVRLTDWDASEHTASRSRATLYLRRSGASNSDRSKNSILKRWIEPNKLRRWTSGSSSYGRRDAASPSIGKDRSSIGS